MKHNEYDANRYQAGLPVPELQLVQVEVTNDRMQRAMKNALRSGINPYNSVEAQGKAYARIMSDAARKAWQ